MTFSNYSTLRLGDQDTGPAKASIGADSRVLAGGGTHTVAPFASDRLVQVFNAGLIDLTNDRCRSHSIGSWSRETIREAAASCLSTPCWKAMARHPTA